MVMIVSVLSILAFQFMQSFRILSNLHFQQQQQLIPDLPVQAANAHININKKGSSLNVLQGGVDIEAGGKEFSSSKDKDEVGDIRGLSSYDSTVVADLNLNVMKQKNQDNLTQGAGKPSPLHKIMVAPFSAYKVDEAGDTKHRSCKKTIIVHGKEGGTMKWSDQPFDELVMSDIPSDSELNDDMLCLQVGPCVAALVSGIHTNSSIQDEGEGASLVIILGSDETDDIVHQLKRDMFEGGIVSVGIEVEIVERKSIAISQWYKPSTPAVRLARSTDGNTGNFIWQFGATRLINPYTTKFLNPLDARKVSVDVDALVMAAANALHVADPDGNDFPVKKDYVYGMSSLVKEIDKPTIMLGIGIQAKFSDIKDSKHIALHEHQAHLMNEIAKRNTLEKSVSVRGEFTETACINAGVHCCLSLGCPSLTISRERNLGQLLGSKWSAVESKLAQDNSTLKMGIGLPNFWKHDDNMKYTKLVDLLLAICENHDCHFIVQAPFDKNLLLKHAGDKVDVKNVHHFTEGVETWFQFMHQLDFVVSTRIHGGMAGIVNGIPSIIIPTDLRILELIHAMKLPYLSFEDVMAKNFESLQAVMGATKKDFINFEQNRLNRLREYKSMLESVGLKMDPLLLDIINK